MMGSLCTAAGDCGWAFWGHVAERTLLHVTVAPFVFAAGLAVWHELRWRGRLPRCRGLLLAAIPISLAMLVVAVREPLDTAAGNAALKSIIDIGSWLVGFALAVVGLARYAGRWAEWAAVMRGQCRWHPGLHRLVTPSRERRC